jgi:hypothetical protein
VLRSSAITRILCGVFGGPVTICPLRCWICRADHRHALIQIDVTPAQPGRLAAPQPAQRDQMEGRVQPVIADRGEEVRGLRHRPHRHRRAFPGTPPMLDPVRGPHHRPRPPRPRQRHQRSRILLN